MKYKGIEYEIRARPGANEWSWTIFPAPSMSLSGETRGSKRLAEIAAEKAIERWLKRQQKNNGDTPATEQPRPQGRGFHLWTVTNHCNFNSIQKSRERF